MTRSAVHDFTDASFDAGKPHLALERRPAVVDDLQPLSWSDPSCLSTEPFPLRRFMVAGFVSIAIVAALLLALLVEGLPT